MNNCFDCGNAIPVSLFEPVCLCKAQDNQLVRAATEQTEDSVGCKLWRKVNE